MKKYVRQIAMGLVLILLVGLLAGCRSRRDPLEDADVSPNYDLLSALQSSYAIFRVDHITDEKKFSSVEYTRLECTQIYKIDSSWPEGTQVDIYYRSIWLEGGYLEEGKTYFAQVKNAANNRIMIAISDGDEPKIVPFEDGYLNIGTKEDFKYTFRDLTELNRILTEPRYADDDFVQRFTCPLASGMTVDEVIRFLEEIKTAR